MLSRKILIAAAAGALSVTPVFAQQPKPVQTVANVSRDTTHATKHTHRRTTKPRTNAATAAKPAMPATPANPTTTSAQPATPATPASPSVKAQQKTPVKHRTIKHSTKKSKKTTADSTKKG